MLRGSNGGLKRRYVNKIDMAKYRDMAWRKSTAPFDRLASLRGLADRSTRHLAGPRVPRFWSFALCLSAQLLSLVDIRERDLTPLASKMFDCGTSDAVSATSCKRHQL